MEVEQEIRRLSRKNNTLEDILSDFIIITERDSRQLRDDFRLIGDRMDKTVSDLKTEISEFKNEVRHEMSEFKNEMSEFKNEMSAYRQKVDAQFEEDRTERKKITKQLGDQSNKLGTFAEDFAAPNLPRIAQEYFGEKEIWSHSVRTTRVNPQNLKQQFEFDAITVTENLVLLLEVKFTPREEYIKRLPELIANFKLCFPEYQSKKLIPVFASWSISENFVRMLTRQGAYAMGMSEETMELYNFDALKK